MCVCVCVYVVTQVLAAVESLGESTLSALRDHLSSASQAPYEIPDDMAEALQVSGTHIDTHPRTRAHRGKHMAAGGWDPAMLHALLQGHTASVSPYWPPLLLPE